MALKIESGSRAAAVIRVWELEQGAMVITSPAIRSHLDDARSYAVAANAAFMSQFLVAQNARSA